MYLVEVDTCDETWQWHYFDTLEEAKKFALEQEGTHCNIYLYLGCKNEYNNQFEMEERK